LGRPGANVLRYQAVHKVRSADFEKLKEIVEQTEVNSNRILDEKEGVKKPVIGGYYVGNIRFEPGEEVGTVTRMNQKDAERIVRSIREAARQADVVLVSHHTHERKGLQKDRPADFARDFAKLFIDSGAHAYIGHGPHIWRGIEIYKSRPIFYSLGDFIFQNDSVERQPTEFYDLYDLGVENTVSDGLDARSANETRGLVVDRKVYESALVSFAVNNGEIGEITLNPLSLGFEYGRSRRGRPQFSNQEDGRRILHDIAVLSEEFGTKIDVKNGVGKINLK
jgi:poly-gamma-glutamate synthesis protein (capsule biosynthesis protein)